MAGATDPQRTPTLARSSSGAEREFVYAVQQRAEAGGASGAAFRLIVLAVVVCAVAFRFGHGTLGLAVGSTLAAWAVWTSLRQARREGGVVLRVDGGKLLIHPWRGAPASRVLALEDVHDVVLDTKTAQTPQASPRGGRGRGGRGGGGGRGGDMSRIELVLAPEVPRVALSEGFASHSETVEQISKLKMFLRRLGWVPEDERE